jgi:hypothetical protein
MEAMRLLRAIGVKPRRTIRIALWDGEEQGFIGSRGYGTSHFFDRAKREKKTEYDKLPVDFNFDNGNGKIRGIYAQGNVAAMPIFESWLEPVRDQKMPRKYFNTGEVPQGRRRERLLVSSFRTVRHGQEILKHPQFGLVGETSPAGEGEPPPVGAKR